MKTALFSCTTEQRESIFGVLRGILAAQPEVLFAYVYGSFLGNQPFHDIDVGVYVAPEAEEKATLFVLDLAIDLESALKREFPGLGHPMVDVRVLNGAPVSFCYHVLKGRLLFSRDENARVRWAERVISRYLDLKPLRHRALKEAMTSWG